MDLRDESGLDQHSGPDRLERAFGAVGLVLGGVRPGQWGLATPCTEWDVRRVVAHLVGLNQVFAALLAGQQPPERRDLPDRELVAEFNSSAALLVSRFREPGVLERTFTSPMGSATGYERLWVRLADLLAHGWDVAKATGQPSELPDELAESALAFVTKQMEGADRTGRFDAPKPRPDDAPATDRLVAFLGRDPGWSHRSP